MSKSETTTAILIVVAVVAILVVVVPIIAGSNHAAACLRVCHPARALRIEDLCHCATATGWERKPSKEADAR